MSTVINLIFLCIILIIFLLKNGWNLYPLAGAEVTETIVSTVTSDTAWIWFIRPISLSDVSDSKHRPPGIVY